MIFYPYKKVIIKTKMTPSEIMSAIDEVTFIDTWFESNYKAIFWGSLNPESNKFKLKLNDNTTMLSYIINARIEEKKDSNNIIFSIRWSMFQMIIYSYFFIIQTIVIFALIGVILFSFDIKGIGMGIFSLSFFYLISKHQLKVIKLKEKQSSIIRNILKLTNGKVVFTNKY